MVTVDSGNDQKVFSANYLHEVLAKLDTEEDGKEFQALKTQIDEEKRIKFVLERVGWSRAKAQHFTPKVIKALRPPNAVLTWQPSQFSFQAYYPIPEAVRAEQEAKLKEKTASSSKKGKGRAATKRVQTHWARSRSYKEARTQLDALVWLVDRLWKMHKDHSGDT